MSERASRAELTLSPSAAGRIDAACDRFEAAWRSGARPRIADFLDGAGSEDRPALLRQLVLLDIDYRRQGRETLAPADYLGGFPELDPAWVGEAMTRGAGSGIETRPLGPVPGAAELEPPELPVVPGHEVLGVLGRGGQGVVYRARQQEPRRLVALKLIPAGAGGPDERARFRLEAEAAAQLQHPNIVQVFQVGEHAGALFLCLEFVEGGSLAAALRRGPLAPRAAAGLVGTLALAVHAAHQRRIIHRDLKPANVLLTPDGTPKVTDFGLAKHLDDDSGRTHSEAILGTPSYMAPEQARGRSREVGTLADVYALGAILYETLTGRPPFRGGSAWETLELVKSQEPVPLSRLDRRLPRDLETICLKCLAKEPAQRYDSAAALAEDLRRFQAGEPIRARPVSAWERGLKWTRRHPARAGVLVLSGLVAVALVLLAASQLSSARVRELERRIRYLADMKTARQAWDEGNVSYLREILTSWLPADPAPRPPAPGDLRGFEWSYLWRLGHGNGFTLDPSAGPIQCLAFSPDAQLLASGHEAGSAGEPGPGAAEVRLWDVASGKVVQVFPGHAGRVVCLAFSPNGRHLASAGGDRSVRLWDLADAGRQAPLEQGVHTPRSPSGLPLPVTCLAFTGDGQQLAAAVGDPGAPDEAGELRLWDVPTGKVRATVRLPGSVAAMAFRPNHPGHLALAGQDGTVLIQDTTADAGTTVCRAEGHEGVLGLAFSPDGSTLAWSGVDRRVHAWKCGGGAAPQVLGPCPAQVAQLAFSPDGGRLALACWDRGVRLWDVRRRREERRLAGHGDQVLAVAFRPGGAEAGAPDLVSAGADGAVKVWRLQDGDAGPECRVLRGAAAPVSEAAVSPDGTRLAVAAGGTLSVREAAGGKVLWHVAYPEGLVHAVAFSPSGLYLAAGCERPREGAAAETGGLHPPLAGRPVETGGLHPSLAGRPASVGEVIVWHAGTGAEVWRRAEPGGGVQCVAFAADGRTLASAGGDGLVTTWDAAGGEPVSRFHGHRGSAWAVRFDPRGRHLASCGQDGTVRVWDLATARQVRSWDAHTGAVNDLAYSPDGAYLATTGEDRVVRLWDAASYRQLHAPGLRGHTGWVTSIAFSPDGRRLASAGRDRTVRLWDPRTGQEALLLRGHALPVNSVAFRPDGRALVSAGDDRTVRVWEATPLGSDD